MGNPDPEIEALKRQVGALQARVEDLAARPSAESAAPPSGPARVGAEVETDEREEADVDLVAPKPGAMVGIGVGTEAGTVVRRVPLASLSGRGRSVVPVGAEIGMYLTRLLHREARASRTAPERLAAHTSESYTSTHDAALGQSGDAGLIAIETATRGAPPRLAVHALPWVPVGGPVSDKEISSLRKRAETVATDLDALASSPRLTILMVLREGSRTGAELQQSLGFTTGQLYHHLRPLAAAGYLRRDGDRHYAISGRGRKALLTAELLSSQISSDRFSETLERVAEAEGDTHYKVYAGERSTEVPLEDTPQGGGPSTAS